MPPEQKLINNLFNIYKHYFDDHIKDNIYLSYYDRNYYIHVTKLISELSKPYAKRLFRNYLNYFWCK